MKKQFAWLPRMVAAVVLAARTWGATVTWTGGGGDGSYVTPANWSPGLPSATDYADTVVFGSGATARTVLIGDLNNPTWAPDHPSHYGIRFGTAGWVLSDAAGYHYTDLTRLESAGSGENVIDAFFNAHADAAWTVSAGNTLVLDKGFYQRNKTITLTGGGTLEVSSRIGGYGGTLGTWGVRVQDASLVIRDSLPFVAGSAGVVYLAHPDACLYLFTGVAAAQALIGSRVLDETGIGLAATDAGGGYTVIAPDLPPPPPGPWTAWTGGAGDGNYANAANWSPRLPRATDYEDTVIFGYEGIPDTIAIRDLNNPTWAPDHPNHYGVRFETSGWMVTDAAGYHYTDLTTLESYAAGVNILDSAFNAHANATWMVRPGSTLVLAQSFYQRNKQVNLTGGGTLQIEGRISGYSGTVGTWGLHVQEGLLVINDTLPYSTGSAGAVFLAGEGARLRLVTSVSAATAMIGSRIRDETGLGLVVADAGGGYAEVSVALPPFEPPGPPPGEWTLVFEDEFDGTTLNPGNWRVGQHWLGINGAGGNAPDNIAVHDGVLDMTAEKRTVVFGGQTYSYATGEVSTFQQFRQKYGYFEARIRYDAVRGVWPAFWTMPDRGGYGWAANTHESYLRFSLAGLPPSIGQAILKVKVLTATSGGNVTVHRVLSGAWSEATVTWNTKPTFDPSWFAQISNPAAGAVLSIDVTDYINAQRAAGGNAEFALVDIYMRDRLLTFGSRESAASDRPVLLVDGVSYGAAADAYVRAGEYAANNYGTATDLRVRDPWSDTSSTYNGGMEMDIMESLGIWGADQTQHALHWDGYGTDHQSAGSPRITIPPTPDGYHVYGMHWQPGQIEFYIDGELSWQYVNPRVCSVESYILLSHQLGGWDGNGTISDSLLPATMSVDYVRVWTQNP